MHNDQAIVEFGWALRTYSVSPEQSALLIRCIGALGGGHRLKDFESLEELKEVWPVLKKIKELVEGIERGSNKNDRPFFHPVGDVCNWYFVIDHPILSSNQRAKLQKAIEALNHKFRNTTADCLAKISKRGMVMAVAGGPHKSWAIWHVLSRGRPSPWITHLVTDHESARWIIDHENRNKVSARSR